MTWDQNHGCVEQTGRPQRGGIGGYWEKLATEHIYVYITHGHRKQCGEVGGIIK